MFVPFNCDLEISRIFVYNGSCFGKFNNYIDRFNIFEIFGQNRGSLSSTPTMAQNKKAPQEPYTEPFIHPPNTIEGKKIETW